MVSAPEPSIVLLRRIQAGDTGAWDDLYLRYRDRLLFTIRCQLGPGLRARLQSEDVLHSVVRDALSDLQQFVPHDDGALARYLHVCVRNKILKKAAFHGAQRRAGSVPLSDSLAERLPQARDELGYVDSDRYEALEAALQRLDEPMRTVVLGRVVEGLTNAELGAAIGKSEEATKKIYQRAVARLGVVLSLAPGAP
ncbi:MAG TPA: sigma-70 family RNA polymerase sigma factor [Planctomycetota bacterium]|nr:sigma-70 family RNA polymerase sigma factor [Planctomycetota bacterium]